MHIYFFILACVTVSFFGFSASFEMFDTSPPPKDLPVNTVYYQLKNPDELLSDMNFHMSESDAVRLLTTTEEGRVIQRSIKERLTPITRFFELQLYKVPAVVVDGRFVIYGINNFDEASNIYKQHCLIHQCR